MAGECALFTKDAACICSWQQAAGSGPGYNCCDCIVSQQCTCTQCKPLHCAANRPAFLVQLQATEVVQQSGMAAEASTLSTKLDSGAVAALVQPLQPDAHGGECRCLRCSSHQIMFASPFCGSPLRSGCHLCSTRCHLRVSGRLLQLLCCMPPFGHLQATNGVKSASEH